MKKKEWEKPQLIILLKGEPEENVLAGCKMNHTPSGPQGAYNACMRGSKGNQYGHEKNKDVGNRNWHGFCKKCKHDRSS